MKINFNEWYMNLRTYLHNNSYFEDVNESNMQTQYLNGCSYIDCAEYLINKK